MGKEMLQDTFAPRGATLSMRAFTFAAFLLLIAAPFSMAHEPMGTLRNYCEDPSEWNTHDYGIVNGVLKHPALFEIELKGLAKVDGGGKMVGTLTEGNLAGDCNGDTIPADYDGHGEYAARGAWLMVDSGDGATTGSLACYGELGHHPAFGPITVTDLVFGTTLPFWVASDTQIIVPPTDPGDPICGDFQTDESTLCTGSCFVTFPEGWDGGYVVYVGDPLTGVVGEMGHISSP